MRCADELQIRSLAGRYSDAIITRSAEAAADCYAPDGQLQPFTDPPIVGREQLVAAFQDVLDRHAFIFQMTHQGFVAFDDADPDVASARWHISEFGRQMDSSSGTLFMGTYQDELRRIDGRWSFAKRLLRGVYMGRVDLPGHTFDQFFGPWGVAH